nr:unnamed protein product [Digitaria exilis]
MATGETSMETIQRGSTLPNGDIYVGNFAGLVPHGFGKYTVGKITPVPLREVRSNDFGPRARIRMYFPCEGSQYTPPHCSVNFFWKDYCPMVFREYIAIEKLVAYLLNYFLPQPDSDLVQYEEKSSWKGFLLAAHEPGTTVGGSHIRGSMVRASEAGYEEVDLVLPGTGRFRVQLGVNMPARALKVREDMNTELENPDSIEEYDVVLYLGIIDILQEYNVSKRVEHAVKSLKFDPLSISAVDPNSYSKRFVKFLESVFPEQY